MSIFLGKHFAKLQSNLELKDTHQGLVEQRHNAVRTYLENNSTRTIETKLIGSLQRQTRVHPRPDDVFDIDILVILGTFSTRSPSGLSSNQALGILDELLQTSDRYSVMNPVQDAPTVTFPYGDGKIKVELVPAYRDNIGLSLDGAQSYQQGRCYWVAKEHGWEIADYDFEAVYLTEMNKATGGRLIPFIKVLKALKRHVLDIEGLDSVHLEILATELLPGLVARRIANNFPINTPLLLIDMMNEMQKYLNQPINFQGSHFPDRYIREPALSYLTRALPIISENMISLLNPNLPETTRIAGWKELFGTVFPEEVE
ncbi:hypothetical protein LRY60_05435 [Candidatus Woesebacteria bacterium]|nr:hypothetical protein [Candidatus Woesebacteria bacterium]MCD8507467.1 hypothetical protein [Candidatus Woesebacteria bacterium]MCD8545821.1 hypothetical protein [Candidatus Woesebacteria bacterium]